MPPLESTTPSRPQAGGDRLSLNHKTLEHTTLPDLLTHLEARQIGWVGLWLESVWDLGVEAVRAMLASHHVGVSSLCRGGFLTSDAAWADGTASYNRRAVQTAADLGAECLTIVVGGLPTGSRDLAAARSTARAHLAELASWAGDAGVRLALEPMHPLFAADRGVLSTLAQAREWIDDLDPRIVGLALDAFHLWWDPDLATGIAASTGRVFSVQIGDWATPLRLGETVERVMPGDGSIDLTDFVGLSDAAGYTGPIEVELFNQQIAAGDPSEVLDLVTARFSALMGDRC